MLALELHFYLILLCAKDAFLLIYVVLSVLLNACLDSLFVDSLTAMFFYFNVYVIIYIIRGQLHILCFVSFVWIVVHNLELVFGQSSPILYTTITFIIILLQEIIALKRFTGSC